MKFSIQFFHKLVELAVPLGVFNPSRGVSNQDRDQNTEYTLLVKDKDPRSMALASYITSYSGGLNASAPKSLRK